jgi:hypothetical protein
VAADQDRHESDGADDDQFQDVVLIGRHDVGRRGDQRDDEARAQGQDLSEAVGGPPPCCAACELLLADGLSLHPPLPLGAQVHLHEGPGCGRQPALPPQPGTSATPRPWPLPVTNQPVRKLESRISIRLAGILPSPCRGEIAHSLMGSSGWAAARGLGLAPVGSSSRTLVSDRGVEIAVRQRGRRVRKDDEDLDSDGAVGKHDAVSQHSVASQETTISHDAAGSHHTPPKSPPASR